MRVLAFRKRLFVVTMKGGTLMEYKIVEKPAFTFAGVSKRVPLQFEGVNNAILELAQSITQEQKEEMHQLQNIEPYETVNVSYESDTNFLANGALRRPVLRSKTAAMRS